MKKGVACRRQFATASLFVLILILSSQCHRPAAQTNGGNVDSADLNMQAEYPDSDSLAIIQARVDHEAEIQKERYFALEAHYDSMPLPTKVNAARAYLQAQRDANTEPWMQQADYYADSTLNDLKQVNYAFSPADQARIRASEGKLTLAWDEAVRIFHISELAPRILENPYDSIAFEVIQAGGSTPFLAYHPVLVPAWDDHLFYVADNRLLAYQSVFHHYGLEVDGYNWPGVGPIIHHNSCLGSGTGIWFFVECFYTLRDGKVVPLMRYFSESNFSIWGDARNFWIQSKVVSKAPLRIQYDWYFTLGEKNFMSKKHFLSQKQTVSYQFDGKGNLQIDYSKGMLNPERMAAFSLTGSHELFAHAWYDELIKALEGSGKRRDMVLAFWQEAAISAEMLEE